MRFRPDVDETPEVELGPGGKPTGQVILGKSGILSPEPHEARVQCPKCGSPALVAFDETEEKYGAAIPGFHCQAGDCGHVGVAIRRVA